MSTHKPTFMMDAMLGNLARKMRLLGFDSKYDSKIDDAELVKIGEKQRRIIVTKDEALTKIAEKSGVITVLIRGNDEIDQIIQIASKIGIPGFAVDSTTSRCVNCNGKLGSIDKIRVMNKVPDGVYERQDKFWICADCKKIYWEGTHFEKLQEFVESLNQRLA